MMRGLTVTIEHKVRQARQKLTLQWNNSVELLFFINYLFFTNVFIPIGITLLFRGYVTPNTQIGLRQQYKRLGNSGGTRKHTHTQTITLCLSMELMVRCYKVGGLVVGKSVNFIWWGTLQWWEQLWFTPKIYYRTVGDVFWFVLVYTALMSANSLNDWHFPGTFTF